MNELASEQLAALAQVSDSLERARIDYWLFGGWAVDFYAGKLTRPHDDVDLAVWLRDRGRIAALLEETDWRHAPRPDEDGGTGYERGAVRLELTFLVRDETDAVVTALRKGRATWPEGAFATDVAELQGVRSRVIGLRALTDGKAWAREEPIDAAKDRADLEHLARLAE